MAEEKKEHKRKRLIEHRITHTDDGKAIHHHTYASHDGHPEPERRNVAVSSSPEEAGQHVADMMAQNQQAPPPPDPGAAEPSPAPGGPDASAMMGG